MFRQGECFQYAFTVTPAIYHGFIDLFGDRNCLHTNRAFAQDRGFSSVVMHGNILNGFLSYFVGECLPVKNVIIHSQEIKFMKPVYLDDVLDLHAELVDYFESVNTAQFSFFFENRDNVKVAKGKIQVGVI